MTEILTQLHQEALPEDLQAIVGRVGETALQNPEATQPGVHLEIDLSGDKQLSDTFVMVGNRAQAGLGAPVTTAEQNYTTLLTNEPEKLRLLLDGGPAGLEEAASGQELTIHTLHGHGDLRLSSKYETFLYLNDVDVHPDHTFTINEQRRGLLPATDADFSSSFVDKVIDFNNRNTPNQMSYNIASATFDHAWTEAMRKPVHEAYAQLGFALNGTDFERSLTLPLPQEFKRRVDQARAEKRGPIYYPDVKLMEAGEIPNDAYIAAWAEGKYPVATTDFYYYNHDIASEHLNGLIQYGEPFMELATGLAQASQKLDTMSFGPMIGKDPGDFSGPDKKSRVVQLLDSLTSDVSQLYMDQVPARSGQEGEQITSHFTDVVNAMRATGSLGETQVVKSLMAKGRIKSVEDVTGPLVIDELLAMTRERFDVKVKEPPVEKPRPKIEF